MGELFLNRKDFFLNCFFKWAKLAKFIRFEAGWKLMWWCGDVVMRWKSRIRKSRHQDEVRDAACEVRVFLSQSSRRIGEMIVFLSALRNIGNCEDVKLKYFSLWRDSSLCCASFRMTRFCFLLTIRNLNYFWNAKIIYYSYVFKEAKWEFASELMKRVF